MLKTIKPEGDDRKDFEKMMSYVYKPEMLEIGEDGFYVNEGVQSAFQEFKEILFQLWANSSDGW